MGRPAKHDPDDFIDAAVELFARGGARSVALSAVAASIGAANGSIYHRFADRASLLAAMWLRTSARFERGYRGQLGEPNLESVVAVGPWVVEWCRDHPAEAQVLQAGLRAFGPDDWPPEARAALTTPDDIRRDLRRIAKRLAASTSATPDEIAFAMLELPIAIVRRALHAGRAPGKREVDLVRGLMARILGDPSDRT